MIELFVVALISLALVLYVQARLTAHEIRRNRARSPRAQDRAMVIAGGPRRSGNSPLLLAFNPKASDPKRREAGGSDR